jgi:peptidoglycan-N-acetylglucosamine deacetylase
MPANGTIGSGRSTARAARGPRRGAAASGAALALALVLGGCSMETTAPADARGDAKGEVTGVDCEKVKCIALTFDSSPGKDTPELLDFLKKEKVPVTFFVMGRGHLTRWPQVVKRFADEGHEVANHTWTHPRLDKLKPGEIREELERTQKELRRITGRTPNLMRPPQGRINDDVTQVSKDLGLAQILWNATAKDYATTDSALIEKRILKQAKRDGIILLHDIYDGTVPAVPGIVHELKKRGYTFVTVSQLIAPAEPVPGKVYRP